MNLPNGHQGVMPYLILNGASKFIDFVTKVFGAEVVFRQADGERKDAIMHAEVNINGSTVMFADSTNQWEVQVAGLFVYVENADETFARAMAAGADVVLELADKEYGRSGGIKDPTGNTWWITSIS